MIELEQAGAELVDTIPDDPAGIDRIKSRGKSRRRRRLAAYASVPVLLGVALVATGLAMSGTAKPVEHVQLTPGLTTTSVATTPVALPLAVAGPPGWQHGDFDDARLWVPANWRVLPPGSGSCGGQPMLLLGDARIENTCGTQPAAPTVTMTTIPASISGWVSAGTANGHKLFSPPTENPAVQTYAAPDLGVTVTFSRPTLQAVLATLGPSPRGIVLWTGATSPTPAGWRPVVYRGVRVETPPTWPIVDGSHTGACGDTFPTQPTAFVGPDNNAAVYHGCAPVLAERLPFVDGVWLQPAEQPASGTTIITTPSGASITLTGDTGAHAIDLTYHQVDIKLGIGPDPAIARDILDSLSYAPNQLDSPVQGICPAPSGPRAMPTPERLTTRLVLERGDDALNPPNPTDNPAITAQNAWKTLGGNYQGAQSVRLILARYSSLFPAKPNGHGGYTPEIQNVLAWIAYSTPIITSQGPCATFTLSPMDATTGQRLGLSEYGGGP